MVRCPVCPWEGPPQEFLKHFEVCPSRASIGVVREGGVKSGLICLFCGELHPSHECPYIPEERAKFIYDLVDFDDLIQALFKRINERLGGPPLELEIYRVERARFQLDGYAGVPGKVILTINSQKSHLIEAEVVIATLIHEILHHIYPELSEIEIAEIQKAKWRELYGDLPDPFPFLKLKMEAVFGG